MAPAGQGPTILDLRLKTPQRINTVMLRLYNVALFPERLDILVREPGEQAWRPVPARLVTDRRHFAYYFAPATVNSSRAAGVAQ